MTSRDFNLAKTQHKSNKIISVSCKEKFTSENEKEGSQLRYIT